MLRVELVNMMCTAYEYLTVGYVTTSLAYYYYIYRLEKTPITGRKRSIILSKKNTEKLSQFVFKIYTENHAGNIVPPQDPQSQRVTTLVNRLLNANSDLPEIQVKNWTVTVLDDPTHNAFTLPNGNIFVSTGLLQLCSSDDELAINLSHEIAHSVLGHGRESLNNILLLGAVKVLSIGMFPIHLISIIPYILSCKVLNIMFYYPQSRMQEKEADKVGLQLAAKACFDVRSAVVFWRKIAQVDQIKQPPEWRSTHPSHTARQMELEEQLPSVIRLRKLCGCPRLPLIDPRQKLLYKTFKDRLKQK